MKMSHIAIAIDGPSGAGKSTIARRIANELGFQYVDTGAIYRTVGLYAYQNNVDPDDAIAVEGLLKTISLKIRYIDGVQHMILGDEDVSDRIRINEISSYASRVSKHPAVRTFLMKMQRDTLLENDVIMDGRDIGTVVMPNAKVKIYLTATPEERARRRYEELIAKGQSVEYGQILEEVKQRDYNDSHRATAPLKAAEDAVLVDTTDMDFEQSVALMKKIIEERL